MSETTLIEYALDYTMPRIIDTFRSIPEDRVCVQPQACLNAPGFVFGHIAVTERKHVGMFLQGVSDIPDAYLIFLGGEPEKTLHPKRHPNSHNSIREWFVMTIRHQNCMMGWLEIMKRLAEERSWHPRLHTTAHGSR
jgi:hypothetical protein